MACYSIDGVIPIVDATAYVHPSAELIGDVVIGPHCYVGPLASLRGDFCRIQIGAGANVQDCCVLHGFPGHATIVEENGHIGHGAILHSALIRRGALVGMHAVVMDDAEIGEDAILAACTFVRAGMKVEPRSLYSGVPARLMRILTDKEIAWKTAGTCSYQDLAVRSLKTMAPVTPLRALEPGRPRLNVPDVRPLIDVERT
jgi:phenylacetic acid degradation protein